MSIDTAGVLLDVTIAAVLVALAWRCVTTADRFESVALFIGGGLMMAIAWSRLNSPDLALAEAALGAGVMGALLVAAWAETPHVRPRKDGGITVAFGVAVAAMLLTAAGLVPLLDGEASLANAANASLPQTGVTHPVTAVLVDFRAIDTLLELCVLLAALVATWQLGRAHRLLPAPLRGTLFVTAARIVLPMLLMLAGALLWRGASAPGGAFQAGAVLAAAGVLLLLTTPAGKAPALLGYYRIGASLGVLAFLGLGLVMIAINGGFLDWPASSAGALVLLAEAGATVAIGLTLTLLVVGGRPDSGRRDPGDAS